jgi:carbon monoxide dehydrogenase subunit G
MELTESYTIPVSQQRAWEALNDTAILHESIPGCESIEPDGDNAYLVSMRVVVGPVNAHFKGRMMLTDIDAPHTYTIVFEGQGGVAGFGKGSAKVTLEPSDEGATKLTYGVTAQVGGKLAQIGSRLVDSAARKMANEFFRRFTGRLAGENGAGTDGESGHEDAGATDAAAVDAASADAGSDQPKRKRSWKAWISKS